MNNRELNEKTLELLRQKLVEEDTLLIIAIAIDIKTHEYSQVVGYGVNMPMLADAFATSYLSLSIEAAKKGRT